MAGVYQGRIDAYYSGTTGGNRPLWQKDGSSYGQHNIRLSVVGARGALASDNYVTVDGARFWTNGGLPLFPRVLGDAAANYVGSWSAGVVGSSFINDNAHRSNVTGATWSCTFTGTSVQILSDRHPNHGYADVTIDGIYRGRYDGYYSVGTGGKQIVWRSGGSPAAVTRSV